MNKRRLFYFTLFVSVFFSTSALAEVVEVTPEDNWCDVANGAQPGEIIELTPGDHLDTCHLRAAGTEDEPVIIRSSDSEDRARLAYSGTGANTIEVRDDSEHLVIENLHFPGTAGPHAIRFRGTRDITIRGNLFESTGGVTMSANHSGEYNERLHIIDNTLFDLDTTAIYFGCHQGDCHVRDARIEGNMIYGVDSPGVGYGIQVKVESNAVIRDNAIFDTKGPGIMVYGATEEMASSKIDGNVVGASRTSGGILAGGGPVVITNNMVFGNATHGIHVYEHNEGAPHVDEGVVAHNTAFANHGTEIHAPGWSSGEQMVVNNAIFADGDSAFGGNPTGVIEDNVVCEDAEECFFAPGESPFSLAPVEAGPLDEAASIFEEDWFPTRDFMGRLREGSVSAGALEVGDAEGEPWLEVGQSRPERIDEEQDGDDGDEQEDDDGDEQEDDDGDEQEDDDGDESEEEEATAEPDSSEEASCATVGTSDSAGELLFALLMLSMLYGLRHRRSAERLGRQRPKA